MYDKVSKLNNGQRYYTLGYLYISDSTHCSPSSTGTSAAKMSMAFLKTCFNSSSCYFVQNCLTLAAITLHIFPHPDESLIPYHQPSLACPSYHKLIIGCVYFWPAERAKRFRCALSCNCFARSQPISAIGYPTSCNV